MKMKLIAIAAIALSPAVVFGQARTHIRVSKDGSHNTMSTSGANGDVTSTPAPAAEPAPAPAPEPTPAPTTSTTTTTTDSSSNQYGTGAVAPTPTHSQQGDSATTTTTTTTTDSSSMSGMKMDSSATPVDTVRVNHDPLQVSPVDSVRMGIPSTKETQRADSARAAKTP
jgi:hypothetical protein